MQLALGCILRIASKIPCWTQASRRMCKCQRYSCKQLENGRIRCNRSTSAATAGSQTHDLYNLLFEYEAAPGLGSEPLLFACRPEMLLCSFCNCKKTWAE
jgi:hypothetical protein